MKHPIQFLTLLVFSVLWASEVKAEVPTKIPPDKERGEALYREFCVGCHGPQALGNGPTAASFGWQPQAMSLAGRYDNKNIDNAVKIIQMGQLLMPAYEQQFDRHESKRIMIWLNGLDPVKGAPLTESKESSEDSDADESNKDASGTQPEVNTEQKSTDGAPVEGLDNNPSITEPSSQESPSQPPEEQE
ncbi:MAG: c-type cytochrome [Myxococcota bacterium]